ncbi:HEAT repeat domain-containing protein [Singulisphaera sp. Ch08]|uniref:HEAT repeat domain-containing protein n=1 Tax=Singulisphaera sp. Ch08 TaxID=3120278 RepID=A0AAU7CFJ6_9BACT
MRCYRSRFGLSSLIALVAIFALVFWGVRTSNDLSPPHLWIRWLTETDVPRRRLAAEELGRGAGSVDVAAQALARAIRSNTDPETRRLSCVSLAKLLGRGGHETSLVAAVVAELVGALTDPTPSVRRAAAEALGELATDHASVLPALMKTARDNDQWVRGAAVGSLAYVTRRTQSSIGQSDIREWLVETADDPSDHVRESGIHAFWILNVKSPAVSRTMLTDSNVKARRMAVRAMGRHQGLASAVGDTLLTGLKDDDASVRAGAARALGGVTPPPGSARHDLVQLLSNSVPAVRQAARQSLELIKDSTFDTSVQSARENSP